MTLVRLPIGGRGRFALSVLKRWGLNVRRRGRCANASFVENEGQLEYLLHDAHRAWRSHHKKIRHDEEAQKAHNADWDLVRRSFLRRGITLND